jgi:WD40 repeat protein
MSEPFEYIYGSVNKYMKKCDGNTGECSQVYKGHLKPIGCICFTSNFDNFVSASEDKTLIIWDTDTGKKLRVLEGHKSCVNNTYDISDVNCVAISPDDLTIVSGGSDNNVMVWDLPNGKLRMTLTGHESYVLSVAISPTGEKIASGSSDETVRIWSLLGVDAGKLLYTLKDNVCSVWSVVFIPGCAGQQVISGSMDRRIRVWSVDDGVNVGSIDVGTFIISLAVTSSGDKVVCGCGDNSVRVYNLHTQQLIRKMDGHTDTVMEITMTPDEQHFITGAEDKSIIKWRMDSGLKVQTLTDHHYRITSVACCPSALISDRDVQLKFSGRIVNAFLKEILYTVNLQTRVETREDIVILREEEIVVTTIKTSDSSRALEWKNWILAVKHHMSLPREQRARTASGIMTRYKSYWLQVKNINERATADFLPKHCVNLIIHYIYK